MPAALEHLNLTVADAQATATLLASLFDWRIRWQGPSLNGGHAVHVGDDTQYLALHTPAKAPGDPAPRFSQSGALNHIGLVVPDLDAAEARVRDLGYTPHSHAEYEPGRRFYFDGPDGVEYELVAY